MPEPEVDVALAKAFAARWMSPTSTGVPPRPHFRPPTGHANPRPPTWEWPDVVRVLEAQQAGRFAELAAQVWESFVQRRFKSLLVTSAHRAEGRTTFALLLAKALIHPERKAVLIETDFYQPSLARSLNLRSPVTLEDLVAPRPAPTSNLTQAAEGPLWLIPLRAAIKHPRELVASPAWHCLMAKLRREFDLIVLDGAPLLTGQAAVLPRTSVDASVLVFRRAKDAERGLNRAREALIGAGIPLLGLAENLV